MRASMKKILSSIFALSMILNCVSVAVQANDVETNSAVQTKIENFEDDVWATTDESWNVWPKDFVELFNWQSKYYVEVKADEKDAQNKAVFIDLNATKTRWIKLKTSALTSLPSDGTGTLTYEFRIRFPESNTSSGDSPVTAYAGYNASGEGLKEVAIIQANKTRVSSAQKEKAYTNTQYEWRTLKFVYNLSAHTYDLYSDEDQVCDDISYGGSDDLMTSGMLLRCYGSANTGNTADWWLDDVKVTYVAEVEMVSGISIGGNAVENFAYGTKNYTVKVPSDVYEALNESNVAVTKTSDYSDATVTVAVGEETEGTKTVTVKVSSFYSETTYTILCKEIVGVMNVVITECRLEQNKLIFAGNVSSSIGPRKTDIIVDTYKNNDSPPDIGDSDKNVTVKSDVNGDFSGSLILDDSGNEPEIYTLNVRFYTNEETEPLEKTLQYANDAQYKQSVENLSNSSEGIFEFMTSADGEITAEQNKILFKTLGIWLDEYESLDDATAKSSVNAKVEEYKSQLTNENIYEIVNGSLAAVMLPRLSVADGAKMLREYDEHTNTLVINETSFSKLGSTSQEWIVGNAVSNISTTNIRTRAIAPGEFETYETLITEVRKSMLLELVDTTSYVDLADFILENDELIDDTDGSLAKLQGMTDDEKIETVMSNVKLANENSKFTTTSALISKVGWEIDNLPDNDDDDYGYHGGGGSSGGRGNGGSFSIQAGATAPAVPIVPAVPSTPTEQTTVFSDMIGYDWAKEAVNSLYEAKIVSGTGSGSFSPQREVTREEFIKLVCVAFDVEKNDAELKFSDVKVGEWYYPYVTYGVNLGIIKGISEERFGVGQHITREDMAVMIQRALEAKNVNIAVGSLEFNDSASISDYATDAVAALTAEGIINGVGDNRFLPKATATRAEAAVIIYRCILKYFK